MKTWHLLACVLAVAASGCSKHDCDLSSEDDNKKYGEIAEMTGGANHCLISNGELVATHYDAKVDEISTKYQEFLVSKSWTVEVKEHTSQRANGKELVGKLVVAKNGDKGVATLVYELTEGIVETVTTTK